MRRIPSFVIAIALAWSVSCAQQANQSPVAPSNGPVLGPSSLDLRGLADSSTEPVLEVGDTVSIAELSIEGDGGFIESELAAKNTCVIQGTLVDKQTSKALANVPATFTPKAGGTLSYTVTTNSAGKFKITLPCGAYVMTLIVNGTSKTFQITFTKSASNVRIVVIVPPKALPPQCDFKALMGAYKKCDDTYMPHDKGAYGKCWGRVRPWSDGGCKPWPFVP